MINIKQITKQIILNIKYFFHNKNQIIFIVFPILLASLLLVVFLPEVQGLAIALEISLIPSLGVIFATLSFRVSNSTIYRNLKVSKNNKYNFYISIALSMIIASLLILFSLLIILTIFSKIEILEVFWLKYDYDDFHFNFFNKGIWIVILSTIEISLILFFMSFIFTRISSSERTYYILMIVLSLLSIVFGGTLNSSFWPGMKDWSSGNYTFMQFKDSQFNVNMFIPSLFFPLYPSGQIIYIYSHLSLINSDGLFGDTGIIGWGQLGIFRWQTASIVYSKCLDQMWRWNIVLILPLIWMVIFGSTGIGISKLSNK